MCENQEALTLELIQIQNATTFVAERNLSRHSLGGGDLSRRPEHPTGELFLWGHSGSLSGKVWGGVCRWLVPFVSVKVTISRHDFPRTVLVVDDCRCEVLCCYELPAIVPCAIVSQIGYC